MQVTVTNENILQGSFEGLLHIFYRTISEERFKMLLLTWIQNILNLLLQGFEMHSIYIRRLWFLLSKYMINDFVVFPTSSY